MPLRKHAIAVFSLMLLAATPVNAGTVNIDAGSTPDNVVVEAKDATLKEIVDALGVRFNFKVESTVTVGDGLVGTGRWRGPGNAVELLHVLTMSCDPGNRADRVRFVRLCRVALERERRSGSGGQWRL